MVGGIDAAVGLYSTEASGLQAARTTSSGASPASGELASQPLTHDDGRQVNYSGPTDRPGPDPATGGPEGTSTRRGITRQPARPGQCPADDHRPSSTYPA